MDQEFIAYLDERFRESSRQMEGIRNELGTLVRQEVGTLRQEMMSRFEQVDEAIRQNREATEQNREAIQQNREAIQQNSEAIQENKDEIRYTRIMVEGLRRDLQGVAEGVLGANQRIDALREEMKQEIGKVRGLVDLSHKAHRDVNKRVRSLEEWRKRMSEDPAPRLRKKVAKKS